MRDRTKGNARSGRRPRTTFAALLGALLTLLAVPVVASAAGTLDQSQTTTSNAGAMVWGTIWEAQTFTAGRTGGLDHVDVNLTRTACDPGPLTVQVRTTSGGLPTFTVLGETTVPSSSVSTGGSYVSVPFTPPLQSVSGTQYAIVLGAPRGNSSCEYNWSANNANPYARGQFDSSNDGGWDWGAIPTFDANFRTFVVVGKPRATTLAATSVKRKQATLHGIVNPSGQATTYHFELATGYGRRTRETSAGFDNANHSVAAVVTGLKPNKLYHYRLVATNTTGTTVGADHTFKTKP